jgi:hypothetical protein
MRKGGKEDMRGKNTRGEGGGHLLLGVLGSGARNPYGILELGSQRGSVPSWLGG